MPKHKGKVPVTNMSTNGNGQSTYIPPDIEWTDDEPVIIFGCSQHIEHLPQCDGNCNSMIATELQVKVMNEARAWARIPMSFHGVPTCLPDGAFDGLKVDIFAEKMRTLALQKIIVANGIATEEEINDMYLEVKLSEMKEVRERYEESVKQHNLKSHIAVAQKPKLINPFEQ